MLYINYIIYTLDCRLKHYKMNRKECKIQDMNRLGVKLTHFEPSLPILMKSRRQN